LLRGAHGLSRVEGGWQEGFVLPTGAYVMNLARFGMFGGSIASETFGPTWTLAVEE
jgi:hypothetical protein